jgi:hypothetical protein
LIFRLQGSDPDRIPCVSAETPNQPNQMKPTNLQEVAAEIFETISPTSRIGFQIAQILAHAEAWKLAGDSALSALADLNKQIGNDVNHEIVIKRREQLRTM